jgi:site-specific recombinase XerD
METAVLWLESRRPSWSYGTYCQYRSALFRLERYLTSGDISRTLCQSIDDFACRDAALKLPKPLYELYREIKSLFTQRFCETSIYKYSQGCKDFLLFVAEQGCNTPGEITIDPIIEYSPKFHGMTRCHRGNRGGNLAGIVNLLTFMAERGDIPYCYSGVLTRDSANRLSLLKLEQTGEAFQPSKWLEPLARSYLSSLDEMRYSTPSKLLYNNDLTNFFLFLELNHIEYSDEAVALWLEKQTSHGPIWERRRHTLKQFADYLKTGTSNRGDIYAWKPLQIESLPEWSKNITLDYLAEREKEGLARSTIQMCRAGCYRLFTFLDSKGVLTSSGITPEILKEFHNTDSHSTPEGKNAYNIKIRHLLMFMAEKGLVPKNLYLALSAECAPHSNIVSVMSEEMIAAVYDYREKAKTSFELRDAAIVMLGMRMGLRGVDIVNLKVENFNWQKQKTEGHAVLSFIQQKTGKGISLPIPVDVGNSVYKYIIQGRPESASAGNGYVFVRHMAPFANVGTNVCRQAISNVLKASGLELQSGQGFHISRRTFASQLLTARTPIRRIADSLGHATTEHVKEYLLHDEDGMRLCALPFATIGGAV